MVFFEEQYCSIGSGVVCRHHLTKDLFLGYMLDLFQYKRIPFLICLHHFLPVNLGKLPIGSHKDCRLPKGFPKMTVSNA